MVDVDAFTLDESLRDSWDIDERELLRLANETLDAW
jgi:hypothetical protein